MWFYATDGTSHGPVDFEQLIASLQRTPDPPAAHVWRDGMLAWQTAGTLPELAARLVPPLARTPPPPPVPQAAAPVSDASPDAEFAPDGETRVATILAVARDYRRLILLVAAEIVVCWPLKEPVLNGASSLQTIALVLLVLVMLGFAIPMAVTVHPLMVALDEGAPAAWSVAMFLPGVNLATALVISAKAQAWFRRRGIYVGLLGPSQVSLDFIRRG